MALQKPVENQIMESIREHRTILDDHTKRLKNIESKVEQVDRRFEQVDRRFEQVDQKFAEITRILNAIRDDIKDLKQNR